ncbi:uncharacterized protein LOC120346747 isoform X3 [Styela clava]
MWNMEIYLMRFIVFLVFVEFTTSVVDPDVYYSFDTGCTPCSLCAEADIPENNDDYKLTGGCTVTNGKDYRTEGMVGKALIIEYEQMDITLGLETCITKLDTAEDIGGLPIKECVGFTLSFWIKLSSFKDGETEEFIFQTARDNKGPTTIGVLISVDNSGKLTVQVQTRGVFHELEVENKLNFEEWTHLILVWEENELLELYFNATKETGVDKKYDVPKSSLRHDIVIGGESLNMTIDELKIWNNQFSYAKVIEIFREASIDPSDFTTPQATTQVDTTTDTVTQAVTTMMSSTTTSRVKITTPPLYLESPIPSLEEVSEELYRTQIENEQKDFTDQETLEESSEKVIQISSELAEKIEEDDVKMESEIAASYISAVSETTNTLVATKNAETWKEVPENTKKLNEIIENADSATEVIVRSFTPANVTSIQVIQTLSMSIIVVPSKTETPVSVSPTQNVEVGLSESTVTSLSQNTPVVVAATVHSGASDCYNDIPPTDVDIIDQEDPVENPEFGLRPTFDSTKPLQIITEIVSVNIKPKLKTGELITLSFVHIMNISLENEFNLFCAYINKTTAKWTNHDCKIIETNNTHTTFVSPHLTNFAILMQVVDFEIPENHLKNLSLITYIGCSISIFCLVLSLCVFALVKNAFEESGNIRGHRTERYHLHANLALSMLLGQVTFLVGADNPPGTDSCKATAILLHFFYMSAFSWMLVEGLHLYNLVVKVFRSAQSRLGYYYMIGWGTPLLICTISVAAAFSGYGENKNCWLDINNTMVIWAFAGPALFVILVNTIILIKVTRVITTLAKSKDNCLSCMTDKATVVVCAKGIAVLMPILGVTWVFGVFAVNEDTIIFQYLFAIFNSLQGFFLFMFHCIFNSETRASLKYRTKSFRSDLQSRSASHSRSRRQTKVELVRNAEQVNPAKGGEGNSNSFRNPAHTQVTPLGSPTSNRQASTSSNNTSTRSAKRNGFKQFNNTERGNVGSRPASGNSDNFPSRRVTKAW